MLVWISGGLIEIMARDLVQAKASNSSFSIVMVFHIEICVEREFDNAIADPNILLVFFR